MTTINSLSTCILGYLSAAKAPEGVQSAIEGCFHLTEAEERTLRFNKLYREELDTLQRIWTVQYAESVSDYRVDQTHHHERVDLLFRRCIAELQNRKRALLLAAGPSEPYQLMAENFEEIVCLNIDHAHAKREVQKLPLEQQRKFTFITFDLSHGLFARFARLFAQIRVEQQASPPLDDTKLFQIAGRGLGEILKFEPSPASQLKFNADFTSSCCVLSQLNFAPLHSAEIRCDQLLGAPFKITDFYRKSIPLDHRLADRHFGDLYHWTNKSGLACLIDTTFRIKFKFSKDPGAPLKLIDKINLLGPRRLLEPRKRFFDVVRVDRQNIAYQSWPWLLGAEEGFIVYPWILKPKAKISPGGHP